MNDEIKVIFFDLGQTLVDLSLITNSMVRVLDNYLSLEKDELQIFVVLWGKMIHERFMKVRYESYESTKEISRYCLEQLCQDQSIDLPSDIMHSIVELIWADFVSSSRIYSDVNNVLSELKRSGYVLGLISDSDEDVCRGILNKHGLMYFFDVVIISGQLQRYKPDKRVFREALEKMQKNPTECMYVGDSQIDIKGARDLGFFTVIINRAEPLKHEDIGVIPDLQISNLTELIHFLND
jgi:2-haloalkanoic acid dehalogenase type II